MCQKWWLGVHDQQQSRHGESAEREAQEGQGEHDDKDVTSEPVLQLRLGVEVKWVFGDKVFLRIDKVKEPVGLALFAQFQCFVNLCFP